MRNLTRRIWLALFGLILVSVLWRIAQTPAQVAVHSLGGVQIVGDSDFRTRTLTALNLVEHTRYAAMVKANISVIRQAQRSGMDAYEAKPTYEVGAPTYRAQPEWYASTIVHDGFHSKLYHDAKLKGNGAVPLEAWTGVRAEQACLRVQIEALEDLKAPPYEVSYVRKLIQNPTYQGDPARQSDYEKRNW